MANVRASQVAINYVFDSPTDLRVSQVAISYVYLPVQPVRASQVALSIVYLLPPDEPAALIPEWPVEEVWEWRTSIHKAMTGREQRMALRDEPRVSFKYDLPVMSDENRRRLLYMLHRHGAKVHNFPMWQYYTSVTGARSAGATTVDVDTTVSNFRVGEKAAIFSEDLSVYFTVTISAISSTTLTISDELGLPVGINSSYFIAPAPFVRWNDGQQLTMDRYFGRTSLMFEVEPDFAVLRPGQTTGSAFSTLNSFPILPNAFITSGGVGEVLNYNPKVFDTGLNAPVVQRNWHQPQVIHARKYLIDRDAGEMDYWREFAEIIKGGRDAFLLPSWREDFVLNTTPALGASLLTTDDTAVADWMSDFGHRYIQLVTANGVIYRKVDDAFLNGDNTVTLNLASALGSNPGDNEISMISFMPKVRLSGDKMTFRHYKNHSEVLFSAATVRD